MQISGSFQSCWGSKSVQTSRKTSFLTAYTCRNRCSTRIHAHKKAEPQNKQEKKTGFTPKLNALLLAALPFMAASPAAANEIQHYISLAAPGLAVVFGSLAYAIASPPAIKKTLLTTSKNFEDLTLNEILHAEYVPGPAEAPVVAEVKRNMFSIRQSFDDVSLDEILQTEYAPCPGAVPPVRVVSQAKEEVQDTIEELVPAISEKAVATGSPVLAVLTRETGAGNATHIDEFEALTPKEVIEGRGRTMLMAFAGKQGRTGSLSQKAQPASSRNGKANSLQNGKSTADSSTVKAAKELAGYVMEWTGLDAREAQRVLSNSNVKGNVVPLHKSNDSAAPKELVTLTTTAKDSRDTGNNGAEMATVALVAEVPTAAVAKLAETPIKSNSQLQEEHKQKIEALMSQVSSIKAVAVTPVPVSSPSKEYDTKISALKQTASQKQKEAGARGQQRTNPESKMNKATQERLQAVQPYSALARTNKPQGLAKLHPKALIASFMDTVMAMWSFFVRAARRITGQDPPTPQMQT